MFVLLLTVWLLPVTASAEHLVLDYFYRYNCQAGVPDHIMNAIEVPGGRAIVSSNRGLTLIDLDNLPTGGAMDYIDRQLGYNARDIYHGSEGIYYVNLHRRDPSLGAGLAVVRLEGDNLQVVDVFEEQEVLLEKMCVVDSYLYVAAHAYGLRIYSIADPLAPVLVGGLTEGFVDAFAVTVTNRTAFIADGAAGLKIVDVSDPTNPSIMDGETLDSAAGTAQDITNRDSVIYVALGGAGLGVYPDGEIERREVVPLNGCAESICWVGEHLAVGTLSGVVIFDVSGSEPELVGGENTARRETTAALRICSGVNSASNSRLLCSDWNYLDVYRLTEESSGTEADITSSHQRIRFAPEGGMQQVTLTNDGSFPVVIDGISSTNHAFDCTDMDGAINPGESSTINISYDGSGEEASGIILISSNDPDENPLPIQVFGRTSYLDPGEMAIDFTLPVLTYDHDAGEFHEESFTLSDQRGKVVWFQTFGTW